MGDAGVTGPARGVGLEGGLILALALGVYWDSRGYPSSLVPGAPGPAFFPRLLAIGLAVCAVLLMVRARRGSSAGLSGEKADSAADPKPTSWSRLAMAITTIAGFLVAAPWSGAVPALPILVVALMWLTGERSAGALIAVPLAFAAFIYGVFSVGLGVPLPSGLL